MSSNTDSPVSLGSLIRQHYPTATSPAGRAAWYGIVTAVFKTHKQFLVRWHTGFYGRYSYTDNSLTVITR